MAKTYAKIKLAFVAILVATTSPLLVQASGLEKHLTDPVVVRQPSNISESCIPGSQKGMEIDARSGSHSGKVGVKHQRDGYQFWFENTSAGITHWYEYDDCRIISIFLAHPIADNPPAPEKTVITTEYQVPPVKDNSSTETVVTETATPVGLPPGCTREYTAGYVDGYEINC